MIANSLLPSGRTPSRIAAAIWSSVQLPIPLLLSGVMFGVRQVPNVSGISRPPPYTWSRSGPVGPTAVWQIAHAAAFARYAPRSTSLGSGRAGSAGSSFAGSTDFGAGAGFGADAGASSLDFLQAISAAHSRTCLIMAGMHNRSPKKAEGPL